MVMVLKDELRCTEDIMLKIFKKELEIKNKDKLLRSRLDILCSILNINSKNFDLTLSDLLERKILLAEHRRRDLLLAFNNDRYKF